MTTWRQKNGIFALVGAMIVPDSRPNTGIGTAKGAMSRDNEPIRMVLGWCGHGSVIIGEPM